MAKKYDESDGIWRTVGGRRIFIRNDQTLAEAMKESGKFKREKTQKNGINKELQDETYKFLRESSWLKDLETDIEDYDNFKDYKNAVEEEFELLIKEESADDSDRDYVMNELNNIGKKYEKTSEQRRFPTTEEAVANLNKAREEQAKQQKAWDEQVEKVQRDYEKKSSNDLFNMSEQELKDELNHNQAMLNEMERRLTKYKLSDEQTEELEDRAARYEATRDDIKSELKRRKEQPVQRDASDKKVVKEMKLNEDEVTSYSQWKEDYGTNIAELEKDLKLSERYLDKDSEGYREAKKSLENGRKYLEDLKNFKKNSEEKEKMKKMGTTEYLMQKQRERGNYKDEKTNSLQLKANEVVKAMRSEPKTFFEGRKDIEEEAKQIYAEDGIWATSDSNVAYFAKKYGIPKTQAKQFIEDTGKRFDEENRAKNNKIRNEAFKKYKKEHPNSKMSLEEFLKK